MMGREIVKEGEGWYNEKNECLLLNFAFRRGI